MTGIFLVGLLVASSIDGGNLSAGPVPAGGDRGCHVVLDGGAYDGGVPADAGPAGDAVFEARPSEPVPAYRGPAPLVWGKVKYTGKVLARGTKQPLDGATIHLSVGDGTQATAESAADGSFVVYALPGERTLRVQCPGYTPIVERIPVIPGADEQVVRLDLRNAGERYETIVTAAPKEEPVVPLSKEDILHTAGSLGDPFRVVESLPGVAQATWPLPLYAIRGANPGNTGFFIDGVRAPALFHFALGPSVIHPFFIEEMSFYPGGYPIRYGRYASGVVAADTATPAADRLHVSADVRLFDAGGIAAMPFHDGKGSVAVAGRYSYTGFLLSSFSDDYMVDYWDYQLRVDHKLGPGKLVLFAFGSGDQLEQKHPDVTDYGFVNQPNAIGPGVARLMFHRLQLRWDGAFAGGRLMAAAVVGMDDSTVSLTSLFSLPVGSRMYTVAPRIAERWFIRSWLELEVGADGEVQWVRPDSLVKRVGGFLLDNYETDLFSDRRAVAAGAYAGLTFHAGDRLTVTPAFRADAYFEEGTYRVAPSPRLLVRLRVGPHDWLKATVGQFSQMPSLPVGVPGFESFGLATYGLQRSQQGSVGFESALVERLGVDLNIDTSLYYQRLHLTDLKNSLIPDPEDPHLLEVRQGESYGLEVMIRRPVKNKLYGWLAYTLSRSKRVVDGFVVPSDWDQRHILNLVVGCRLPRDYLASVRFHYNSGRPYPLYSEYNFDVQGYIRLPGFPQLDLRAEKRFVFDNYVLDAYIEVLNATLSREVFDVKQQSNAAIHENAYRLVLPSAGVHIEW